MSSELPSWINTIAWPIIILLLGVIGFFLKQLIREIKEMNISIGKLTTVTKVQEKDFSNLKEGCYQKHIIVDNRLNEHAKRLDDHDRNIAVLKSKSNEK